MRKREICSCWDEVGEVDCYILDSERGTELAACYFRIAEDEISFRVVKISCAGDGKQTREENEKIIEELHVETLDEVFTTRHEKRN